MKERIAKTAALLTATDKRVDAQVKGFWIHARYDKGPVIKFDTATDLDYFGDKSETEARVAVVGKYLEQLRKTTPKKIDHPVLKGLQKRFKDTSIRTASDIKLEGLEPISTGSISLDLALGVPLAYGITEFAGQEGVGKTTMALEAIANAQKRGFKCYYFNVERSINEKSLAGVDIDKDTLVIIEPESAEAICDFITGIISAGEKNFIAVDSVASMTSEKVLAESSSKEFMALTARLLSRFLPTVLHKLQDKKSVLMLLNQLRENISPYGGPYFTPGGKAIKYYCSERVYLKTTKGNRISGEESDDFRGHMVEAEVVKNRFNPPFKKAIFPIMYLPGPHIDRYREVADLSIDFAIVSKGGAWITLPDGETKIQGKDAYVSTLKDNPDLYGEVERKLMEIIG